MPSYVEQFRHDGFLFRRQLLDRAYINDIYKDARAIFGRQIERVAGKCVDIDDRDVFEHAMFDFFASDFEAFVSTGKTVQHSLSLHRLGVYEEILSLLKELGISQPVIGTRPSMQFNSRFLAKDSSKHWKLDAHQDWRTGQGSLDSVVIWIPLVAADASLGALQIVPGSHTLGLLEATDVGYQGGMCESIPDEAFVQTEFAVGDLLVFSSFLVHRSGDNITRNIRWSVQLRYNNLSEETFIERGYPMAYAYKPEPGLLTPDFPEPRQLANLFGSKQER